MPKFHVRVPEVWYQTVEIEAEDAEEAVELVRDGDGEYLNGVLEFSHTMDDWDFSVSEVR